MDRTDKKSWPLYAFCATLYVGGVLTVVALAACSSAVLKPVSICRNTDWFEKGRSDGLIGLPANEIESHKRLCNSTDHPVDEDLYNNGRNNGLLEYCTPQVGVQRGKEALPYLNVCPSHLEEPFLNGYKVGGKIRALEFQNSQVQNQMQALAAKLGKDLTDEAQAPEATSSKNRPRTPASEQGDRSAKPNNSSSNGDRSQLSPSLYREYQQLKKQHSKIDSEILDLESEQI